MLTDKKKIHKKIRLRELLSYACSNFGHIPQNVNIWVSIQMKRTFENVNNVSYMWYKVHLSPTAIISTKKISFKSYTLSLSLFPYLSAVFSDLASPDPPLHFSPLFASIFKYNIKVGIMENNAKLLRFKTKYKKKKTQSNLSPVWLRCSITDVCWCRLIINWHTFPFLQRHDGFASGRLWCRAILRYAAS